MTEVDHEWTANSSCVNGIVQNNRGDEDCDGRSDEHYGTYNIGCGRHVALVHV